MLVPIRRLPLQERAGGVGPVDLEPPVRRDELDGGIPADVVQDGGDGVGLTVTVL
jgi:hypothetical protein